PARRAQLCASQLCSTIATVTTMRRVVYRTYREWKRMTPATSVRVEPCCRHVRCGRSSLLIPGASFAAPPQMVPAIAALRNDEHRRSLLQSPFDTRDHVGERLGGFVYRITVEMSSALAGRIQFCMEICNKVLRRFPCRAASTMGDLTLEMLGLALAL